MTEVFHSLFLFLWASVRFHSSIQTFKWSIINAFVICSFAVMYSIRLVSVSESIEFMVAKALSSNVYLWFFLQSLNLCKVFIFGLFLLHFGVISKNNTGSIGLTLSSSSSLLFYILPITLQYWTVPGNMWIVSHHLTNPPTQRWAYIKQ